MVRIGRLLSGLFDPLEALGGSVLQRRSVRELDPNCPVAPEVVPAGATIVSFRLTPPVFGDGLIEAISEAEILRRADPKDLNRDGVTGVPNLVLNPETKRMEVGRFGWKAQNPTLHLFAGEAYLNELGITNPTFPRENLPQGQAIPPEWDPLSETDGQLEDDGEDTEALATFMRFLAAPARRNDRAAVGGEQLFTQVGCASCHTPRMTTGAHPVAALRFRNVELWSDLLLHDMGPELADGVPQGQARGSQWRTTPLWGVGQRRFLMHDGRATTLEQSIRLHGGESTASRARFDGLRQRDRETLLTFLRSL